MDAASRSQRARVAALSRHRPNHPETAEAAARFRAERLTEHIRRLVAEAPPLSPEQKAVLAGLVRGCLS